MKENPPNKNERSEECCDKCKGFFAGSCIKVDCPCHPQEQASEKSQCCGAEKELCNPHAPYDSAFGCSKCKMPFIPQSTEVTEDKPECYICNTSKRYEFYPGAILPICDKHNFPTQPTVGGWEERIMELSYKGTIDTASAIGFIKQVEQEAYYRGINKANSSFDVVTLREQGAITERERVREMIEKLEVGKPKSESDEEVYFVKNQWLKETKKVILDSLNKK